MAMVFALVAAASWGAADFLGGLAGRRASADVSVAISFVTQSIGLIGLSALAIVVGGEALSGNDVPLTVGAGAGGAIGVTLLYRGLTVGSMGVVAPITGAGAAVLPVVVGAVRGELPTLLGWFGIATALVAIVLVSREVPTAPDAGHTPAKPPSMRKTGRLAPGVLEAVGAGIGFGLIFVMLGAASDGTGLWPLVPMKLSAVTLLGLVGLVGRRRLLVPRGSLLPVVGVGLLDNLANVAYLLATRRGLLALVAVVSSLYPVGTVLLARVVLNERLAPHQVVGLGLAGIAVAMLAVG